MAVTIVGLSFLVAGLPFLWLARRIRARDRAIARWPRAPGTVTSSKLTTSTHRIEDANTRLYSYQTWYSPSVQFTYVVAGQTYDGRSIARSLDEGLQTSEKSARRIIAPYPAGASIEVLYDPTNPKVAYLEVRGSAGPIIIAGIGLLLMGIGALVLVVSLT